MSGDVLKYRSFVMVEELAIDECTIHHATKGDAKFLNFWFYVNRDSDGQPEVFCVPVIPNGSYTENGLGGRSWGLTRSGDGWQISPSIDVYTDADAKAVRAGQPRHEASLWHNTPRVVDVPDGEAWQ